MKRLGDESDKEELRARVVSARAEAERVPLTAVRCRRSSQ